MNKNTFKMLAISTAGVVLAGLILANFNTGVIAQSRNGFGG